MRMIPIQFQSIELMLIVGVRVEHSMDMDEYEEGRWYNLQLNSRYKGSEYSNHSQIFNSRVWFDKEFFSYIGYSIEKSSSENKCITQYFIRSCDDYLHTIRGLWKSCELDKHCKKVFIDSDLLEFLFHPEYLPI